MATCMTVNGAIYSTAMEFGRAQRVVLTLVNGSTDFDKATGSTSSQLVKSMKVNGLRIKGMVKELIRLRMVIRIAVIS
jgi:hypothetical protein